MKILVVDDEAACRMMLRVTLEKIGYTVTEAANGTEALEEAKKTHYPLIVTDWMMPEMDGLDFCRSVRDPESRMYSYIIMVTLLDGRNSLLKALEAGADDFLTKPLDIEHLVARVRVAERIMGLRNRLADLEGLLSICMYCKKIRDDDNQWMQVDRYIEKRSDLQFSHGLCPECYAQELAKVKALR